MFSLFLTLLFFFSILPKNNSLSKELQNFSAQCQEMEQQNKHLTEQLQICQRGTMTDEYEQRLNELESNNDMLNQQLDTARGKIASLQSDLTESEIKLNDLTNHNDHYKAEISKFNEIKVKWESEQRRLTNQLTQTKENLIQLREENKHLQNEKMTFENLFNTIKTHIETSNVANNEQLNNHLQSNFSNLLNTLNEKLNEQSIASMSQITKNMQKEMDALRKENMSLQNKVYSLESQHQQDYQQHQQHQQQHDHRLSNELDHHHNGYRSKQIDFDTINSLNEQIDQLSFEKERLTRELQTAKQSLLDYEEQQRSWETRSNVSSLQEDSYKQRFFEHKDKELRMNGELSRLRRTLDNLNWESTLKQQKLKNECTVLGKKVEHSEARIQDKENQIVELKALQATLYEKIESYRDRYETASQHTARLESEVNHLTLHNDSVCVPAKTKIK